MSPLAGLSVLITGAGSGIGKAAAMAFAGAGARLVLSDLNAASLAATADAIRASGGSALTHPGDVTDEALAPALVELAVKSHGRLDIAINNAGIAHPPMKLPRYSADQARQMFAVNLLSVFLAMKAEIPVMEAQGSGSILNVSSVAGVSGAPLGSTYAAAKHGVIGLTRSAAVESAKKGVRINAICPAFTMTPLVEETLRHMGPTPEEATKRMTAPNPMGRIADVGEIVQAMLWITSPANSFMTGQALVLDGGLTAM